MGSAAHIHVLSDVAAGPGDLWPTKAELEVKLNYITIDFLLSKIFKLCSQTRES
jgi:hypothetical protein